MDGLVVVDKPDGMTSHDVVARLRRATGQRRIGHAGTLDPDATGVLLVGLGRVTRLLRYLQDTGKQYDGTVVFGVATTTLDAAGDVVEERAMPLGRDAVEQAARTLTGRGGLGHARVDEQRAVAVTHAAVLPLRDLGVDGVGPVAIVGEAGDLLAVYERSRVAAKPAVVLAAP